MLKPQIKFKLEKQGEITKRPSQKGNTFNYKGEIFEIISHVKEYVNKEGNIVIYCMVRYYNRFEMKDKTCYTTEIWF